jgi:hypothetical protein
MREPPPRETRRCACRPDCPATFTVSVKSLRRYADERHKVRRYRMKVQHELARAGLPTSLSLRTAQAAKPARSHTGTKTRDGYPEVRRKAPRRARPSDARVSLPRLERVAREVLDERRARALLDAVRSEQGPKAVGR